MVSSREACSTILTLCSQLRRLWENVRGELLRSTETTLYLHRTTATNQNIQHSHRDSEVNFLNQIKQNQDSRSLVDLGSDTKTKGCLKTCNKMTLTKKRQT